MAAADGLGAFLRARRGCVQPADVGLAPGVGLRRTPGLRREELATLAGVSIDYYIRLEQGRETNPSGGILDALAAALLLDEDARAHLYALANRAARRSLPPRSAPGRHVSSSIRLLVEAVRPWPGYVLSRTSDVLAANPEALLLFTGLADWPAARRNTIRYVFLHAAAPELFADWDQAATSAVANLRRVVADDPGSADLTALVDELTAGSEEFARRWDRYDTTPRRGRQKTFHHPSVGTLTLQHEVLWLGDGRSAPGLVRNPAGQPGPRCPFSARDGHVRPMKSAGELRPCR